MTYEEAFTWIENNMDVDDYDSYQDFLNDVYKKFPNASGLIEQLNAGVVVHDFKTNVEIQKTLEEFFEQLRPNSS